MQELMRELLWKLWLTGYNVVILYNATLNDVISGQLGGILKLLLSRNGQFKLYLERDII